MAIDVMTSPSRERTLESLSPQPPEVHATQLCCFRVEADAAVGWGHLQRCLAIAAALPPTLSPVFVLSGQSAEAARWLAARGHRVHCEDDPLTVAGLAGGPPALVLLDMAHMPHLGTPEELEAQVREWQAAGCRTALIDGLPPLALAAQGGWALDLYVAPYCGASAPPDMSPARTLCGPSYAIVPPLRKSRERQAAGPLRLLITFGGADPDGTTLRALEAALALHDRNLTIRVVLGPSFAPELRSAVRRLAVTHDGVALIDSPENLTAQYGWADLAIAGTGLTKYELAAAGLPSVQVSLDADAAAVNRPFEAEDTAVHLGPGSRVSTGMIGRALAALAADTERCERMARRGRALVDGRGAARIAAALEDLTHA
ncbi:MAG: hypothetical protein WD270_10475 [Acetobacterales bacterium]